MDAFTEFGVLIGISLFMNKSNDRVFMTFDESSITKNT